MEVGRVGEEDVQMAINGGGVERAGEGHDMVG